MFAKRHLLATCYASANSVQRARFGSSLTLQMAAKQNLINAQVELCMQGANGLHNIAGSKPTRILGNPMTHALPNFRIWGRPQE